MVLRLLGGALVVLAASGEPTVPAVPLADPAQGPDGGSMEPPGPPPPVEPAPLRRTETVATASRVAVLVSDEGRAVSVVTADELSRRAPRTTPEALSEEEGVFL